MLKVPRVVFVFSSSPFFYIHSYLRPFDSLFNTGGQYAALTGTRNIDRYQILVDLCVVRGIVNRLIHYLQQNAV